MRHLVLSPSPAAASNVPSISDGCIEVPKSIAFADNKKWQLKKVIAEPSGQGAMSAMLSKVKVRYEAQVTVDCNCGNPPPLLSVSGTRVWENEIEVAFGSEVFLATNNPFPYEISTPISGMAGIGELIAEAIKEAFTAYIITNEFKTVVDQTIQSDKPENAREGKWKDDKDPCSDLKRS